MVECYTNGASHALMVEVGRPEGDKMRVTDSGIERWHLNYEEKPNVKSVFLVTLFYSSKRPPAKRKREASSPHIML